MLVGEVDGVTVDACDGKVDGVVQEVEIIGASDGTIEGLMVGDIDE